MGWLGVSCFRTKPFENLQSYPYTVSDNNVAQGAWFFGGIRFMQIPWGWGVKWECGRWKWRFSLLSFTVFRTFYIHVHTSFQPRLSFPSPFQQSLAGFRVPPSPNNSWASCKPLDPSRDKILPINITNHRWRSIFVLFRPLSRVSPFVSILSAHNVTRGEYSSVF